MATDGKDDPVEGSWSARRPRTAAQQPAGQPAVIEKAPPKQALSTDPEALAADIERTRTELAETLDAIADKVSPRRVATRTGKKVGDSVKEAAGKAEAAVKTGAQAAVESVKDAAEAVRVKVGGDHGGPADRGLALADEPVVAVSSDSDVLAPAPVPTTQEIRSAQQTGTLPALAPDAFGDVTPAPTSLRRDVRPVPGYVPAPASSPVPLYAGAAAALVVVLIVLRRRRR